MNSPTDTPAPGGSKTLWAATLVLIVVVLAMGAALIRIQSRPIEPRMSVLPQATPLTHATAPAALASSEVVEPNLPPALMDKAQKAIENKATQAIDITAKPRPVLPRQPEPAVARPPAPDASNATTPESR